MYYYVKSFNELSLEKAMKMLRSTNLLFLLYVILFPKITIASADLGVMVKYFQMVYSIHNGNQDDQAERKKWNTISCQFSAIQREINLVEANRYISETQGFLSSMNLNWQNVSTSKPMLTQFAVDLDLKVGELFHQTSLMDFKVSYLLIPSIHTMAGMQLEVTRKLVSKGNAELGHIEKKINQAISAAKNLNTAIDKCRKFVNSPAAKKYGRNKRVNHHFPGITDLKKANDEGISLLEKINKDLIEERSRLVIVLAQKVIENKGALQFEFRGDEYYLIPDDLMLSVAREIAKSHEEYLFEFEKSTIDAVIGSKREAFEEQEQVFSLSSAVPTNGFIPAIITQSSSFRPDAVASQFRSFRPATTLRNRFDNSSFLNEQEKIANQNKVKEIIELQKRVSKIKMSRF